MLGRCITLLQEEIVKKIFILMNVDRLSFLTLLAQVSKDYNWLIHAYCLMDNHYHLLVETPVNTTQIAQLFAEFEKSGCQVLPFASYPFNIN